MIIEKEIKKIRDKLLKFKHKEKATFLDDFKMIKKCKNIIFDEVKDYIAKNSSITEEEVFAKIFNFFHFEIHTKKEEKSIKKDIVFLLIIGMICMSIIFIISTLLIKGSVLVGILSSLIFLLIIYLLLTLNKNKKQKELDNELRINYIIEEALNELNEEFEDERKKQFLEPAINVELEEEELNELLSEDFLLEDNIKPDITTKIYDRKTSLERRKRRRNLKTK